MSNLGIRDLARLAARAIAIEEALFEACGRWIPTTADPAAKPLLAAAARRHAWHAELWRERFPSIPDADVDEAVTGERGGLVPLLDALAAFDRMPSGPGRVAVVSLAASQLQERHLAALVAVDPLLDAPTTQLLELVGHAPAPAAASEQALSDDERAALDAFRAADPIPSLEVT